MSCALYIRKSKSISDVLQHHLTYHVLPVFVISFPYMIEIVYFRVRSGACASDSKAHREKMRRDKLNDR